MRTWIAGGLGGALALIVAGSAGAGTPYQQKLKCAVGGESFQYTATGSYSTWGSRPDGKPYGSWHFPMPLPVCPKNQLVMYREFTKPEIAVLKGLLDGPDYRALIAAGETSYYRAAWLEEQLSPGSDSRPWILLQASWQADGQPDLRARYQREFIAAADALPAKPGDLDWLALQGRAANAQRELGDFDGAAARIDKLDLSSLDVVVPEKQTRPIEGSQYGQTVLNYDAIREAESRRNWLRYFKSLSEVIARREASTHPLDMIPKETAAAFCKAMPDRSKALPTGFCDTPAMVEAMAKVRN